MNQWQSPPRGIISLREGEVHIWCASLAQNESEVRAFFSVLGRDERDRAERFYFRKDRSHFVIARALMRTIISQYVGAEPRELQFRYGPFGKPELSGDHDGGLRFNIAYSRELAIFGLAFGREIGVDIEYVRLMPDVSSVAEHIFTPREKEEFEALPEHMKNEAFFRCWTRKEAYVKARGVGLSGPLDELYVSVRPQKPEDQLELFGDQMDEHHWTLHDINGCPGYAAALVVEGRVSHTRYLEYD